MSYRYDLTGECVADDRDEAGPRHRCWDGWLENDPETDARRPCLICKPHLRGLGLAWSAPPLRPGVDVA